MNEIKNPLVLNGAEKITELKIVIFIGNGAVADENSWMPVRQAKNFYFDHIDAHNKERLIQKEYFDAQLPFFLANIASWKRIWQFLLKKNGNESGIIKYDQFKQALAYYYAEANFTLREFPSFLKTQLNETSIGIITTNWETSILKLFKSQPTIFIHGNINAPNSMILPTQTALDIYNSRNNQMYDGNFICQAHFQSTYWLENCEILIIWGLALHEYDSELAMILRASKNRLKKLIVVNNKKESFIRASACCHNENCEVIFHNPENSDNNNNFLPQNFVSASLRNDNPAF